MKTLEVEENVSELFFDVNSVKIFKAVIKPMTIKEIAKVTKIPKSTLYLRIVKFVKGGIFVECGKAAARTSKPSKFDKTFKDVTIFIGQNKTRVFLNLKESNRRKA